MSKYLFLFFSFWAQYALAQTDKVIINKNIELVQYEYEPIFIEFITAFHVGSAYYFSQTNNATQRQLYFYNGRTPKPGIELGLTQKLKLSNLAIGIGASFWQINENYSYCDCKAENIEILTEGGTVETKTVLIGEITTLQRINRLNYFSVPLSLEYFFKLQQAQFSLQVSSEVNLLGRTNYFGKFSIFEELTEIKQANFFPQWYSGSLRLGYHINIGESYFAISPFARWAYGNLIDQTYLNYAINGGGISIIYQFTY